MIEPCEDCQALEQELRALEGEVEGLDGQVEQCETVISAQSERLVLLESQMGALRLTIADPAQFGTVEDAYRAVCDVILGRGMA